MIAPENDEVEISVFGPGYGECILVHIGCQEWIIIDSCIDPVTKSPAALQYLRHIGVSPENVELIVATHWHDDHIRGMSEIVNAYGNAEFVFSDALQTNEFVALAAYFGSDIRLKSGSGAQEIVSILRFLGGKNQTPKPAIAERMLWKNNDRNPDCRCEVISLSPSDHSILLSNNQIARLMPEVDTEKRRLLSITPNHAAVVLWIRINDINVLLGSDLEITAEKKCGWIAVLDSKIRPEGKADVFKVPHHGSESSDHPRIWAEMVSDDAVIVVTPFRSGKTRLPKETDIQRICNQRTECFITAIERDKKVKTDRKIDKIINKSGGIKSRKPVNSGFGQVRLRTVLASNSSAKWNVETFSRAGKLCNGIAVKKGNM